MTISTVTPITFPAFDIVRPYEGRKFTHGDKIAIPYISSRGDTLVKFYTLGTAAGYALSYGEDPIEAHLQAVGKGHKTHWANANGAMLHNGPKTQETVPGFNHGDTIILAGKTFTIAKAPNDNIDLKPVHA